MSRRGTGDRPAPGEAALTVRQLAFVIVILVAAIAIGGGFSVSRAAPVLVDECDAGAHVPGCLTGRPAISAPRRAANATPPNSRRGRLAPRQGDAARERSDRAWGFP